MFFEINIVLLTITLTLAIIFGSSSILFFYLGYKAKLNKEEDLAKSKDFTNGTIKNFWLSTKDGFYYTFAFSFLIFTATVIFIFFSYK